MDVILFGGQSNMQGQTECLPETSPVAGAYEYRHAERAVRPLAHPVGEDFGDLLLGAHEGHGSLVPAFCRAYVAERGGQALAVHVAKGATTLSDWKKGGARYALAAEKMRAGIAAAGKNPRVFYVWLQGESDAIAGTGEEEYLAALAAYKDALKADLGIETFGIIKVGYFADGAKDEAIMRAQERAAEGADFLMLTRVCPRLSRDPAYINPFAAGHYNNAAMEIIGGEAGRALAAYAQRTQK